MGRCFSSVAVVTAIVLVLVLEGFASAGPGQGGSSPPSGSDITGPVVTFSGELTAYLSGGEPITPGSYNLNISATDGSPYWHQSGVRSLSLLLNGVVVGSFEQPCSTGSCELSRQFWVNTSGLRTGQGKIDVLAKDWAGNTTKRSWNLTIDHRRTLFRFNPAASLDQVTQSVATAGAKWIELRHTGPTEGGYLLGNESPAEALAVYRAGVVEEHEGAPPIISLVTVGGDVASSALGSLAASVVERYVWVPPETDLDQIDTSPEPNVFYPDDLMAEDVWAETQPFDPRESGSSGALSAQSSAADADAFAPLYGSVETKNVSGDPQPRRIINTLTFPRHAIGDLNGDGDKKESPFERDNALDHGYEHDLKLVDFTSTGGKHPFCTDEKELFWAQRKGYSVFTNYPDGSNPYFDLNIGDPCMYLDFTIGVEYPLQLTPGKKYVTRIRTRAGDKQSSPYYINAQKTFRACPGNPARCSESSGPGADGQKLVFEFSARTMECRRWRKGHLTIRTCDHLQ